MWCCVCLSLRCFQRGWFHLWRQRYAKTEIDVSECLQSCKIKTETRKIGFVFAGPQICTGLTFLGGRRGGVTVNINVTKQWDQWTEALEKKHKWSKNRSSYFSRCWVIIWKAVWSETGFKPTFWGPGWGFSLWRCFCLFLFVYLFVLQCMYTDALNYDSRQHVVSGEHTKCIQVGSTTSEKLLIRNNKSVTHSRSCINTPFCEDLEHLGAILYRFTFTCQLICE